MQAKGGRTRNVRQRRSESATNQTAHRTPRAPQLLDQVRACCVRHLSTRTEDACAGWMALPTGFQHASFRATFRARS